MTTEKNTTRKMTMNGFITKCHSNKAKASAMGFLAAHKEYLLTGEPAEITSPIVAEYDNGKITASEALEVIKRVVWDHIQATTEEKIKKSIEKNKNRVSTPSKAFHVKVVDAQGNLQYKKNEDGEWKPIEAWFDMPQDAERFAIRRLVEGAVDWFGVIDHNSRLNGMVNWSTIDRDEAYYKSFKAGAKPVIKRTGQAAGRIGNNMRIKNDKSYFSQG